MLPRDGKIHFRYPSYSVRYWMEPHQKRSICIESLLNALRPKQNGRHFPDDILKYIFLNENVWISVQISMKFVPGARINNITALVQIKAWRRPGDKPLSEPVMVSLLTHSCVTRPLWVNDTFDWWNEIRTFNVIYKLLWLVKFIIPFLQPLQSMLTYPIHSQVNRPIITHRDKTTWQVVTNLFPDDNHSTLQISRLMHHVK